MVLWIPGSLWQTGLIAEIMFMRHGSILKPAGQISGPAWVVS
jgi:hypothetical protein